MREPDLAGTRSPGNFAFDFSKRANLQQYPELMDQPCSYEDLRGCLRSIAQVNWLTRAYRPTLHWLDHVCHARPQQSRPIHIVDVGCGFGDMLRRVHAWAQKRGVAVRLTGIDLNADAVRAAQAATRPGAVTYLSGNAYDFADPEGIDVVISSLLTHHLEEAEIVRFLHWMEANARMGWFINDLNRQPVPYHLFRVLSRLTHWHRFVKHDGAVSILRSFREPEWREMCRAAAIPAGKYTVRTYMPARLCVARLQESTISAVLSATGS